MVDGEIEVDQETKSLSLTLLLTSLAQQYQLSNYHGIFVFSD